MSRLSPAHSRLPNRAPQTRPAHATTRSKTPPVARLLLCAACTLTIPALAASPHPTPIQQLTPLPPGILLPVLLDQTLNPHHPQPGLSLIAHLTQRVPLPGNHYLPSGIQLHGTVSVWTPTTLTLSFTTLVFHQQQLPIHVRLLCAADWLDVVHTRDPIGGTSRGTADTFNWTTRQIGGDEVYLENSSGIVYNRYSEPVGQADGTGVYSTANPGQLQLAYGPFSTTATGLHDLPGLTLTQPGTATQPITFTLSGNPQGSWRIHAHAGLLLQIVTADTPATP